MIGWLLASVVACSTPAPPQADVAKAVEARPAPFPTAEDDEAARAAATSCPRDGDDALNAGVASLPTDALRAPLGEKAGDWARKDVTPTAGGTGRASAGVTATYAQGEREVHVVVQDMIHACTCETGTGAAQVKADGRWDGAQRSELAIGGRPAVTTRQGDAVALMFWLGDRCSVSVGAAEQVDPMELLGVVGAIDLPALEATCATR